MRHTADRPDWTDAIKSHLEGLRLTPTRARDIADELAQHLDDRYHELRASGATHEKAVQQALASAFQRDRFERSMAPLRQARAQAAFAADGGAWSGILLDVRHVLRRLRKDRGVALATALALALAIGAATTVVSATYAIVLKPLDYTDPARIVNVWLSRSHRPNWHFRVPVADFDVIERNNQAFAGMALYDNETMKMTGGDFPEEVSAGIISAKLFTVLGVRPAIGRDFGPADERDDSGAVVIVSDRLWQRRFGGGVIAPDANVRLNGSTYHIIGVMPRGFGFPDDSDVWLLRNSQRQLNAFLVARLRAGVTVARAQSEMGAMVATITGGRADPGMAFSVEPLQRSVTSPWANSWFLLMAAVGCVLAIGWVNVSNLQLAKALHLQKEIQVRVALGATRGRIIRLLATESLVLAVLGGPLAVLVATLGILAIQMWAPLDTPRLEELRAGQAVVWIALALSLLSALASGLVPALQCSRSAHADGGRLTTATRRQSRARNLLVIFEIAMAIVLLSAAAQLARSLMRLTDIDPGFQTTQLLTVSLPLQGAPTPGAMSRIQFVEQMTDAIESLPGVVSASASSGSVLRGSGLVGARRTLAQRISVDGWARDASHDEADMRRITSDYFSTLGMRVIEGRTFTDGDRHGSAAVAIVNETLANAYWSGQSPIGKRLAFDQSAGRPQWREIVGVVNDTRNTALTEPARPEFYIPLAQDASGFGSDSLTVYVRTSRAPLAVAGDVRARIWSIDRDQAIADISTMEMAVDRFVAGPRFRAIVLSGLAGLGLMLTVIGVYAVMAFVVGQRDREMAIRLALGSERAQIRRLVLSLGCRLAAAGIVTGIAASLLFARLLRGMLFDAAGVEPLMLGAVASVVMAVVLLASYGPARRAANTQPADVLRPG